MNSTKAAANSSGASRNAACPPRNSAMRWSGKLAATLRWRHQGRMRSFVAQANRVGCPMLGMRCRRSASGSPKLAHASTRRGRRLVGRLHDPVTLLARGRLRQHHAVVEIERRTVPTCSASAGREERPHEARRTSGERIDREQPAAVAEHQGAHQIGARRRHPDRRGAPDRAADHNRGCRGQPRQERFQQPGVRRRARRLDGRTAGAVPGPIDGDDLAAVRHAPRQRLEVTRSVGDRVQADHRHPPTLPRHRDVDAGDSHSLHRRPGADVPSPTHCDIHITLVSKGP